jgi:Arc/MetJ-type ribon-helix-helix transcriptional regulator
MSDAVTRVIRIREPTARAVDAAVSSGEYGSADDLVQLALDELLDPPPVLEGDELDALLAEGECSREAYVDGPTFLRALAAKYGLSHPG